MSQRSSSISSAAAVAATAVGNRRQSLMVPNMGGTSDHRTSLMVPGGLSSATASTGRRGTKLGLGISNSVTRRTSSTTSSNILPILGGNTSRRGSALGFDTSGAPSRRGSAVSTVKKGITHTPSGTKFFISEEDEEQQLQNRMSSVTRSRRGSAVLESVYEKDHEIKIRIEGDDEPSSNGRASVKKKQKKNELTLTSS